MVNRDELSNPSIINDEHDDHLKKKADIKPQQNNSKKVIVWGCIAVLIIVVFFAFSMILPKVISGLSSGKEQAEDQGANKLKDVGQSEISFVLPKKPKEEVKPEPVVTPTPVVAPKENSNIFAKEDEKPKVIVKNSYDVLKASRGSMIQTRSTKAQVEAEERRKLADEKLKKAEELKKKAEEQAAEEARLYPYGYTYRLVNGKMVKVPKTSNSNLLVKNTYEDRGSSIGSTIFQAKADAMTLNMDKNFLLQKGTFIPCSLDTRIVSTLAGGVNCTISDDVYSENGNVLLIEKGSKVFGYYENGQVKVGMDRIFVIWQEIRTPEGIVIPVDSGSTSELGDSGTAGYVDYHWALRFTSAVMVSMVDDVFNAMLNGDRKGNKEFRGDKTEDTVSEMATETLKRFIDVEPTLYKNQGDKAAIYVNKDIDFSKVYELDLK